MTFRVFFCTGVCGLLPPGGRFGTNAAGLPCPGDFFGTGAAWSSLTFPVLFLRCFFGTDLSGAVCLLLHCSWESLWSRHRLGSLIFPHYPRESLWNRLQLEQSGLFRTILQAFLWNGCWPRESVLPHTADDGVFLGLMKLAACVLCQSRWGCSQKPGSLPMAMPDRLRAGFPQDIP